MLSDLITMSKLKIMVFKALNIYVALLMEDPEGPFLCACAIITECRIGFFFSNFSKNFDAALMALSDGPFLDS